MSITFNADEIFEMAEKIEKNAVEFYREAEEKCSNDKEKQMFEKLAQMENDHAHIFAEMRTELNPEEMEETVFDPQDEGAMYLQTMASSHGTEGKISPTQKLTGSESIKEVLEIAVDAEKNSVVFYSGLKEFVPQKAGKDKVQKIIKEELGHLATLREYLKGHQ